MSIDSSYLKNHEVLDQNVAIIDDSSYFSTASSSVSPDSTSSSTSMPDTVERKSKKRKGQLCVVCEMPAIGNNFNASSCSGCKIFFRRCALSNSRFRCIRGDSNCFKNLELKLQNNHIKCRSCRLDRCLEQGMQRRAAVTGTLLTDYRSSPDVYSCSRTSRTVQKVNGTVFSLRHTFQQIRKLRRTTVPCDSFEVDISTFLSSPGFLQNVENFEKIGRFPFFQRDLPDWLTLDLACAIGLVTKFPDLNHFNINDKEELVRSSCFVLAIAIQIIDSYLENHQSVIFPDGTDIMEILNSSDEKDGHYWKMFVTVLDPLHRETFSIDELVLALQLLFFTNANPENLSDNGKKKLSQCIQTCMQNILVLLISQDNSSFPSRYGAVTSLNQTFLSVAALHKLKMKAGDPYRQKNRDYLIEQLVFGYRSPK